MTISLSAEPIWHIGTFPVTNTLITSWITVAILIIAALVLKRHLREKPRGLQNVAEAVVGGILNLMDGVTGSREMSKKFFPLIATLFLFIATANWLGLLPGFGPIGIYEVHEGKEVLVPFFRSTNSDLNVTLALAIISVVATQIFGIALIGAVKYSRRFFNFKNPIFTFVGILELFSEVAKLISFSFRLFGNVFAGEVLLVVIAGLIPYVVPLPFYFLEIFVGFIQAFVFAILTLVFLKVATVESH
ncbi:MAG: ATP synthase subunit a [Candidatus Giovannonibacteria bacterium GW2011_GWA2_53_7]|uniref:ATP synthase subunit a n=1 Tax=Candidatus Giovannonibacteria bacterium GW2011_GWA2_53_7 TaxID=1618650 RepID=A0A0G1XW26_9BACT|nr:MAG: ATP synthase subunit a [Candidatus Giovannonibacteria bacterium GW2011_GWA2_53_7]